MQILDIVIATGYAAICLILMVGMAPVAPREAALLSTDQMRLDMTLSIYVNQVGLSFLDSSNQTTICHSVETASNSTLRLDARINGVDCLSQGTGQTAFVPVEMTLNLPTNRSLVLEAWYVV